MSSSSISSEVGLRSGVEVGSEAVPDTSPRLRLRNGDGTTDQPIVKSSPTETRFCLIEAYKPFAVRPENPTVRPATHCARKSPKNRLTAASELSAPRHRRVSDQTISTSAPSVFGAAGARAIAQAGVTWARRIRLREICRSGSPLRAGSGVTVDSLTFLDTTFLHDSAEQCTHDRGTRAYFLASCSKSKSLILHNDIAKFEQNNAGVVLILGTHSSTIQCEFRRAVRSVSELVCVLWAANREIDNSSRIDQIRSALRTPEKSEDSSESRASPQ
jgi:hypothetical protein